jgi:nucleoside-diphosphate-sugar epimerase
MRVFVTGASGWIGSAVVPELIGAGHEVVGLARSDKAAVALVSAGVEAQRGTLDDLDTLRDVADKSDAVIHLAFKHDLVYAGDFKGAADADRRAVETFGEALAGTGRPLIIASGTLGLTPGRLATEQDGHADPFGANASGPSARHATAEFTLSLADHGVRASIVRLPPTVHGEGDNGFMAIIAGIARAKGVSAYIGDGSNRWPATNRLDVAHLFLLALENAAAGSTLHAVAEEGVPIRQIAEAIGRQLDVPVVPVSAEDAVEHFGVLAHFLAIDSPASSALTRELLDWQPTHPGLIADLEAGYYTRRASA